MWDKIKGKKSYAVALATVMFAIGGAATNQFTWQHALELILASGAVVGLRNAIPPVK